MNRQGGTYGLVNVTWTMTRSTEMMPVQRGEVMFADGQTTADISVEIDHDRKPALDTLYFITLVNVSQV